jgi:hypothetical protein
MGRVEGVATELGSPFGRRTSAHPEAALVSAKTQAKVFHGIRMLIVVTLSWDT